MGSSNVLEENRNLFKKMHKIALKQEEYITEDQIEGFVDLTRERDRLRNKITANKKLLGTLSKEEQVGIHRKRNESISREIIDVIESIRETDKRIEGFIMEKKEDLLLDIKKIRRGREAVRGYGRKSSNNPRFIKRRG